MEESKIVTALASSKQVNNMFDEISPTAKNGPKHIQLEQQKLNLPPKAPKLKSRSFIPVKYKAKRASKYQS
jgi:hypothetical protein